MSAFGPYRRALSELRFEIRIKTDIIVLKNEPTLYGSFAFPCDFGCSHLFIIRRA